jgi:predicted CoA-binding protein
LKLFARHKARENAHCSLKAIQMHNNIQQLKQILKSAKTIAVVGLSAQWNRPSYFAAKYMQEQAYKIIPVNPRYAGQGQFPAEDVLGEKCYASLLDISEPVDIVDVFRKTEDVLPIAQEALQIGASCLWQQLGVENQEASELFLNQGKFSVTNRCVKIEHARIFGGLNWVGVNTGIISAKRPID